MGAWAEYNAKKQSRNVFPFLLPFEFRGNVELMPCDKKMDYNKVTFFVVIEKYR